MLVLSRKEDSSIIIDGSIEVAILKIEPPRSKNGDYKVRLGITAPRSISVHRKEIQEAINREKLSAVGLQF